LYLHLKAKEDTNDTLNGAPVETAISLGTSQSKPSANGEYLA
jgi:hypothetical protein